METREQENYKLLSSIIDHIYDQKGKDAMMYILSINVTLSREQRVELANKLSSKILMN
jgi:hypothetical protein